MQLAVESGSLSVITDGLYSSTSTGTAARMGSTYTNSIGTVLRLCATWRGTQHEVIPSSSKEQKIRQGGVEGCSSDIIWTKQFEGVRLLGTTIRTHHTYY